MRMESRNQEAPSDDQNQYEHDFDETCLEYRPHSGSTDLSPGKSFQAQGALLYLQLHM